MKTTAHEIISKLNCMTEQERERVLCELLNHFCVACGRAGDWREETCDCDPSEVREQEPEAIQLWLVYRGEEKAA
jgi:hypothetical protein